MILYSANTDFSNVIPYRDIFEKYICMYVFLFIKLLLFWQEMPAFRWSSIANDIMLAAEVAARRPSSSAEWEVIAGIVSQAFSMVGKPVDLSGRACSERMEQILQKYKDEDRKSLKRY